MNDPAFLARPAGIPQGLSCPASRRAAAALGLPATPAGEGAKPPIPTICSVSPRTAITAVGGKLVRGRRFQTAEAPARPVRRDRRDRRRKPPRQGRRRCFSPSSTACSTSRRRRTPICAGCASPAASSTRYQLRGIASIADDLAGGYADITTRANFQLREIGAAAAAGTAAAAGRTRPYLARRRRRQRAQRHRQPDRRASIRSELIDTRPQARAIHHFILNHRELNGLPRKFNIAFDGGGRVPVLEDTNDIAFTAVEVKDGFGVPAGVCYRARRWAASPGIKRFRPRDRRDPGSPGGHHAGCATRSCACSSCQRRPAPNRNKARLKYLLDRLGPGRSSWTEVEKRSSAGQVDSGWTRRRSRLRRPAQDRSRAISACIAQKEPGKCYVGVVVTCAMGRMHDRSGCVGWPTSPTGSARARSG